MSLSPERATPRPPRCRAPRDEIARNLLEGNNGDINALIAGIGR